MTSEATAGQIPDVYGQVHPVETEELLTSKLQELEQELGTIPTEDKREWMQAMAKCPELVAEDFKLKFLRCEVFNSDLAAKRLVKYWSKRVEIFGDKAFSPITLSEGLSEDEVAVGRGVMTLLDSKDPSGRSLVFWDPSHLDSSKYTTESMVRAFWYVLHAATEDIEAQQHGIIVIVDPQRAYLSQFDSTMGKLFMNSMSGVLPLRLSGIHICYPPYFVSMVLPIVKMFMPERMQKRIRFHSGTHEEVIQSLQAEFGLQPSSLPKEIGGTMELNHMAWLAKRREQGK